jgi:hypothetical protein
MPALRCRHQKLSDRELIFQTIGYKSFFEITIAQGRFEGDRVEFPTMIVVRVGLGVGDGVRAGVRTGATVDEGVAATVWLAEGRGVVAAPSSDASGDGCSTGGSNEPASQNCLMLSLFIAIEIAFPRAGAAGGSTFFPFWVSSTRSGAPSGPEFLSEPYAVTT